MPNPVRYWDVKTGKCVYIGTPVAYSCSVGSELECCSMMAGGCRQFLDDGFQGRSFLWKCGAVQRA